MGTFTETNGENGVRPGTVSEPPNVTAQGNGYNCAGGGCDEDGLAPSASFLHVPLTFEDRDLDALCFGFGFAEGRTDVAEKFHALGANRFAADVAFFDGKLAHVPETGLRRVWIGCLRRFDLGSNRRWRFFVDAQTGNRLRWCGCRDCWSRG